MGLYNILTKHVLISEFVRASDFVYAWEVEIYTFVIQVGAWHGWKIATWVFKQDICFRAN